MTPETNQETKTHSETKSHRTVHVAAESSPVRESLEAMLTLGVVGASSEGVRDLATMAACAPDILVVPTGPEEDAAPRASWCRRAAPDAHLIGFAFSQAQASRAGGVDAVARSNIGRARVLETLRSADKGASPPPEED